jgi:ribonuclease P protein component
LTSRAQFVSVQRQGRPQHHPLLVLRYAPNALDRTRFGFAVGRRVGKAVLRNRVKRRLREAARLTPVRPGWDVVVIARPAAAAADYRALRVALGELLRRAKITKD